MKLDSGQKEMLRQECLRRGMAIGMVMFMPAGIIFWQLLDNPGMLGMGPALGLSIGIAIGEAMFKKEIQGE